MLSQLCSYLKILKGRSIIRQLLSYDHALEYYTDSPMEFGNPSASMLLICILAYEFRTSRRNILYPGTAFLLSPRSMLMMQIRAVLKMALGLWNGIVCGKQCAFTATLDTISVKSILILLYSDVVMDFQLSSLRFVTKFEAIAGNVDSHLLLRFSPIQCRHLCTNSCTVS